MKPVVSAAFFSGSSCAAFPQTAGVLSEEALVNQIRGRNVFPMPSDSGAGRRQFFRGSFVRLAHGGAHLCESAGERKRNLPITAAFSCRAEKRTPFLAPASPSGSRRKQVSLFHFSPLEGHAAVVLPILADAVEQPGVGHRAIDERLPAEWIDGDGRQDLC